MSNDNDLERAAQVCEEYAALLNKGCSETKDLQEVVARQCAARIRALAAAQGKVERIRKADHEAFVLTAALCALPEDKAEKISRSRVMDLVFQWRRKHDAALAEDRHE